jgi:hypothetical protein
MSNLNLSTWSQQHLTFLLIATFLAMIAVLIALLFYIRRTRSQAASGEAAGEPPALQPPPAITVRRKAWAGRMQLEINGQTYRRMKDIEDPNLRRAVMLAVGDLVTFASAAPPGGAAQPPRTIMPDPHAAQQPAGKQHAPAKELAEHALLAQLEQAQMSAPQAQGWMAALGRGFGARHPYGSDNRAFVEDIEDIIQRRRREKDLKQTIHLRADGQGIVRVEVDGVLHDNPGDVPDLAVRELIRAAVGEWEARF